MIFEQKYKSKQVQKSDQNFSNIIMLNCLAALENLAIFCGYKGQKIFDYYSGFTPKDKIKDLVDDAVIQLEIFRASHSNYISNYCNYDFPGNLTKEQIIQIISEWKKFIPDNNIKVFYDEIIHYLNGNSNISGISGIIDERQKEWGPTTEAQLSRISNSIPFINSKMFNQMEQVQKSYKKNGDYEINAKLYKNRDDNIEMKRYYENDQKYMEKEQKFRDLEMKIESVFTELKKGIIVNEKIEWLKNNIESFMKQINLMNLGENEIRNKINLYNEFKNSLLRIMKDRNALNFFEDIIDKLIACYKNKINSDLC